MFAFICEGDSTSHGGTVLKRLSISDVNGKSMVVLGDLVSCPKCGGNFAITTSKNPAITIDGISAAFHGDETSCGAILLSSQVLTAGHVPPAGSGHASDSNGATALDAEGAAASPTLCLECLKAAAMSGASLVPRG